MIDSLHIFQVQAYTWDMKFSYKKMITKDNLGEMI